MVKRFFKGPAASNPSHAYLWRRLWHRLAVRAGTFAVKKVKSHQALHEVAPTAEALLAHWLNDLADEEAEEGARRAQLPFAVQRAVRYADEEAWKVQKLLLQIDMHVVEQYSELYGSVSRTVRLAERRKISHAAAQTKSLAKQQTQHHLNAFSKRCRNCWQSPGLGDEIAWLSAPCPGRPTVFDPTHDLQQHRGLWFCRDCGAWATTKAINLGDICPREAGKDGQEVLRRIQADKLPKGVSAWPDRAMEGQSGLEIVSDICQAGPAWQ